MTTPFSDRPSDEVLVDYLADTLPAASRASVEAWLALAPERQEELELLRTTLVGAALPPVDPSLGATLRARADRWMAMADGEARRDSQGVHRRSRLGKRSLPTGMKFLWRSPSALLIGTISFCLAAIAMMATHPRWTSRRSVTHVYTTAAGQHATVKLPDGSQAVLGAATSLGVVIDGANRKTTVTVQGQALFTVVHHADAAFLVRTGQSVTRVLGTTFLVRKYPTDPFTRIVVSEGRVVIQAIRKGASVGSQAVLIPQTLGVVNDSGQIVLTPNIAVNRYTGWTEGELLFEATPAGDVVADLSRAYGVDITLSDSTLAKHPITWGVQTTRYPLAQALRELTTLLSAHVRKSGNSISIVPGRLAGQRFTPVPSPNTLESQYGR